MKSFGNYYLGIITRPRRTFDALMSDSRRLRFGLLAVSINAVLYTLVYVFLTIGGGAPSSFTPWLAIPADDYYWYNRFFLAPSMFTGWILAAGVAQLLSRPFSGKGSFEDNLSVLGFAISIASLASLLHDLPDTFLGAIGVLNLREYEVALNSPTIWRTILWILYVLYFILFLLLFPKGIGAAQRIRPGPAILIGVLAFIVYQGVFVIFNR
ncbi:MAG: YIP1 family protein [Anaerolineales bacterium]|nr:YIP1 family protein [Anaerolineales bacterium]